MFNFIKILFNYKTLIINCPFIHPQCCHCFDDHSPDNKNKEKLDHKIISFMNCQFDEKNNWEEKEW